MRIARVAGVDYVLKPSLLLMGAVLVAVFTQRFDEAGRSDPLSLALGFVLGLYASVLVHELAHVIAARSFGQRVRSVTLHLLGGETAIEGGSRTPWHELVVSVVGPLASLAIALVCWQVDDRLTGTAGDVVFLIGSVNLVVAIFNLIPGLPLDGGRVLKALIWAATGREAVGITVAGWIGRFTAVALVAYAATRLGDPGYTFQLVIAVLVAFFLWTGAGQAIAGADQVSRVNGLVARDIARPGVPAPGATVLRADLHGGDLIREIAAHPDEQYAVTEADGTVVGSLTLDDLDEAYRTAGDR